MNTFTQEHTPAEIVKVFPKASDLFKSYRIDFCCGGDKVLKDTFVSQQINAEEVLDSLNQAYEAWKKTDEQAIDWDQVPLGELIDYIVNTHHNYLRNELQPLEELVERIYNVHGNEHPHLESLLLLYKEFKKEMIEHSIKEENEVFPLIKQYVAEPNDQLKEDIIFANGGLEAEHDHAGNLLKEMRYITNDFQPPENACGSYRVTYDRLAEMEDKTFMHIHLENNVLFKNI